MALIGRLLRVLVILGMGFLIFFTLQWLSGAPTSINSASFPKFPDIPSYEDAKKRVQGAFSSQPDQAPPSQAAAPLPPPPQVTAVVNKEIGPGTGLPTGYVEEAHKLQNADDFLTHFKAVTQLPGMLMEAVKEGCNWNPGQDVNFQYPSETDWAKADRADGEMQLYRRAWHNFIRNGLIPHKDHASKWAGRGIVIVAGLATGREQIKVVLRALAKVGSTLPVEVHYFGAEMTASDQEEILSVSQNVYFNDLETSSQNIIKSDYVPLFHNYQLKTAAVVNSRFAEILLLDSDNIPVIQPESLFDSGVYKEFGTVFWPDIARTRPNNPIWGITNTKCRKDEFEQESGQLLVNKNKYFYHLQLAAWMNAAPQREYYGKFLLGDKDMFRFAWHALKTRYGKPHKWVKTVGMLHDDLYCGHSFAQHHPDPWNGQIAFVHTGLTKLMKKDFLVWQRENHGGIFQAFQATENDEDPYTVQSVGLKLDELKYWSDRPQSIENVQCNDMFGQKPSLLTEPLPNFEAMFNEIGGYALLENFFG